MNGGKRRGLEKVWHSPNTKLFKKEIKTKTKTPSFECELQWCVTALGSSTALLNLMLLPPHIHPWGGYKFRGPYRNGCLSQLH